MAAAPETFTSILESRDTRGLHSSRRLCASYLQLTEAPLGGDSMVPEAWGSRKVSCLVLFSPRESIAANVKLDSHPAVLLAQEP